MARPKTDLPSVQALRALADVDGRISVRVTPGARNEGVEIASGRVLIKVRAKPEDGKATAAVVDLLGQVLAVPPSKIVLLRGATSREKQFRIPLEA